MSKKVKYSKELLKEQKPKKAVVLCSDSRVCEYYDSGFEFEPGDIFVVRVAGNNVKTAEGSLHYAIFHLGVKELDIVGHNDCGMMKAYMKGSDEDPYIQREIDLLKPVLDDVEYEDVNQLAEENVHKQIEYLMSDEKIRDLVENGKLKINGLYYDFSEGYVKIRKINENGRRLEE